MQINNASQMNATKVAVTTYLAILFGYYSYVSVPYLRRNMMAIAVAKMGDDTFSDKNGLVERYNDDNAIALIKALESLAVAAGSVGMKAAVEPICNARSNVASWAATQDFGSAVMVNKEEARRGTNMLLLFDILLDYILREGRSDY